jgi:ABC-type antimicrobial peptide transport system permease subunit
MFLLKQISMAFVSLRRNVLRSLLTMLGIVIGVAVVITMMEIGAGASSSLKKSISNMGTNVIMIWPSAVNTGGISSGSGGSISLTEADCDAIRNECLSVEAVTPTMSRRGVQAIAGNLNWTPNSIDSGNEDYFTVRSRGEPESGRYFTKREVDTSACVCVIGQTIKEQLFADRDPVGESLRLNSVLFHIIGVMPRKGANMMGQDQDDIVVIPWKTLRSRLSRSGASATASGGGTTTSTTTSTSAVYPESTTSLYPARDATQAKNYPMPVRFNNVDQITLSARSPEQVYDAIAQVTEVLRRCHNISDGKMNDFTVRDMSEMLKTMSSTSGLMTTLLLIVALLSLVVGGVGIMNIMLVSVTERIKEIGLRMAIGATPTMILSQFILEAVVLSTAGGAIGVVVGIITARTIGAVQHWPIEIEFSSALYAFLFSSLVGVFFGFYPAYRASKLNPIDCLRYE